MNTSSPPKNSANATQVQLIHQALALTLPNTPWQSALELFLVTGVADTRQIHQATGLSRGQLERVLDRLEAAGAGLPPILSPVSVNAPRPGQPGKPPKVYRLGESGAALLRSLGHTEATPCGLAEPRAIAHALAMLDVHQCGVHSGQAILTDCTLSYGSGQTLRPDHHVRLADGRLLFYEVEQSATPHSLRRIRDALERRRAFFGSPQAAEVLPQVRLIFGLGRSARLRRTLDIWRQALRQLEAEASESLPFRLLALPLGEFLEQPEWDADPSGRWDDLGAAVDPQGETALEPAGSAAPVFDLAPQHRPLVESLQRAQSALGERLPPDVPRPDMQLWANAVAIFEASHDESDPLAGLLPPTASVTLLGQYLASRPGLIEILRQAMHPPRARLVWNTLAILHAMQRVIDAFLANHGWSNAGPLRAVAAISTGWESGMTGPYGVQVSLSFSILTRELAPQSMRLRRALAWVLWALFAHAEPLGLGRPEFW